MTSRTPTFIRVIARAYPGSETVAGVAATYNASEATAWTTAVASATPTGSTDAAEATYLASCLTAAVTAGYTEGSQTGGVGPKDTSNGIGCAIITRLLALGTNDLSS